MQTAEPRDGFTVTAAKMHKSVAILNIREREL